MSDWEKPKAPVGVATPAMSSSTPKVPKSSLAKKAEESEVIYTDDKIKGWLFGDLEKTSSNICCAFYGFDGTAKSGIAMDCRNEQEVKDGMKVVIFDLDGGCAPLKVIYHDNDKNIIIRNPIVRDALKNVDYELTFQQLKSAIDYIERNLSTLKIKAIIFDGIDKFLKICEYKMRDDVGKNVTEGVDYRYWKLRNQAYYDIMEQLKLLDVDRYFITHMKKDGMEAGADYIPDWEKKTPDMMFQRGRCYKEVKVEDGEKVTYIKVDIEKCKTNIGLEGKVFTVASIKQKSDGTSEDLWKGLTFNSDNTISQKDKK